MKKVIPAVVVLCVVLVAAFFVLKKVAVHEPRGAELVPAETILFLQIPDTKTTLERFEKTALAKIFAEPEMEELMQAPREKAPGMAALGRMMGLLPREGFVAITSIDGAVPTFVAGVAFSGFESAAEKLVAEWRGEMRKGWPAGRADLVSYGKREIETFTDKDFMLAEVICDGWYFIADNLQLLEQTIDRLDGKGDSLAASAFYKEATAPLPANPDALLVAQMGTVMERLTSLLVAAGQKTDPAQLDELKKLTGIAAATKFDGELCRDTIFVMRPGGVPEAPLTRGALALSSPATLLYYAMALPLKVEITTESASMLSLIPGFDDLNQSLTAKSLSFADLPKAFGPELGTLLDWPEGADAPSVLLALDVRDREMAATFVGAMTGEKFGSPAWTKTEHDGATLFSAPNADGLALLAPTIALTEKFAVIGMSAEVVTHGLGQLKAGGSKLGGTPAYAAAAGSVVAPTSGFGFIDLPTLFDRSYSVLKPMLAMSLATAPEVGEYFDAGKLPPAATISRHLGPIVYSQATTERGTLIESSGPLTLNQILIAGAASAIAAAVPAMQAALADGTALDPAQLLQSLSPQVKEEAPVLTDEGVERVPGDPAIK